MKFMPEKARPKTIFAALLIALGGVYLLTYPFAMHIRQLYALQKSIIIEDRNGKEVSVKPNRSGYYMKMEEIIPEQFKKLLVKKEDRFFYYHPGINPVSVIRDSIFYLTSGKLKGSSTLTQQLVKVLLGNEERRTLKNKFVESFYAFALELHTKKEGILAMYANSAYFGNQTQGLIEASHFYFGLRPELINNAQILSLLATLNNPSGRFPGSLANRKSISALARALGISREESEQKFYERNEGETARKSRTTQTAFELNSLDISCPVRCRMTVDKEITERLRTILSQNLALPSLATAENGAIVAIKLPENELLAIVGSPDPNSPISGYQINMATRARPVGSTAKPFIYLNAFEKGARPYSLVDDREYVYTIGTGFAFYPKNYDGAYRGTVTLHHALANSLNVPTVKVLEFVGLERMYQFLRETLRFQPIQPLENYEMGIALGALEMDLLTLTHYFTIFPNEGMLKPLVVSYDTPKHFVPPMEAPFAEAQRVSKKETAALVNRILSDRETAVDQFGMKSNLSLPTKTYALKTGTSRDFHDSWTVGYTPDFVIGVWVGNSDNTPLAQLSGQVGAGKIWHDAMELMLNSSYNKKTPFRFDTIKEFNESGTIEYGLPNDQYTTLRNVVRTPSLITQPHSGDTFLFEKTMLIPLRAEHTVRWFINDVFLGEGNEISWNPSRPGTYKIFARSIDGNTQTVVIRINTEE